MLRACVGARGVTYKRPSQGANWRLGNRSSRLMKVIERTGVRRMAVSENKVSDSQATEDDVEFSTFVRKVKEQPSLSIAELARTVVDTSRSAFLSTVSTSAPGFPSASIVEFASDTDGRPILALSTLAAHTRNLEQDGRCSLLIPEKKSMELVNARVTLTGTVVMHKDKESTAGIRDIYLKKHPDSYWVDFDDFRFFRMDSIDSVRYVTNSATAFAKTGTVSGSEYMQAVVDPIAIFSEPICRHMNEDHMNANIEIFKHAYGLEVDKVQLRRLDRLGMDFVITFKGQDLFGARLAFPRPAKDRKHVRELVIEMTNAAKEAAS